ncbi:MAG: sulfotransferase, partial [Dehalococcoidia bacterium]
MHQHTVRPNFLVLGAMKSATTTLCELLATHPQAFVCEPKEPEFFCKDEVYSRGWPWYQSLFRSALHKKAVGEGSTSYTKKLLFPRTASRIAAHVPDARLIYIVRHPIERIESHWMHSLRAGSLPPTADFSAT